MKKFFWATVFTVVFPIAAIHGRLTRMYRLVFWSKQRRADAVQEDVDKFLKVAPKGFRFIEEKLDQ